MSWDKATIQTLLQHSDKAVLRALMQLYARQTASEQSMQMTHDANGVGFNYRDSAVLSDIASRVPHYGRLTPAQTGLVRRRLMKYWRQLAEIANENGAPVPQAVLQKLGRAPYAPALPAEPTDKEVEDMAARVEEAEAIDRWIGNLAAAGGMVAAGDHI